MSCQGERGSDGCSAALRKQVCNSVRKLGGRRGEEKGRGEDDKTEDERGRGKETRRKEKRKRREKSRGGEDRRRVRKRRDRMKVEEEMGEERVGKERGETRGKEDRTGGEKRERKGTLCECLVTSRNTRRGLLSTNNRVTVCD